MDFKVLVATFGMIFLAELGDKTMIMAVGLSTQVNIVGVMIGAIAALATVNLIGVIAGEWITRILPRDKLEFLGAGLFVLTGYLIILL